MSVNVHNPDQYMASLRTIIAQGRKKIGFLVPPGDPPALPGRHPKFDSSGNLIATPKREPPSNTLRSNYETSRQFKSQPVGV